MSRDTSISIKGGGSTALPPPRRYPVVGVLQIVVVVGMICAAFAYSRAPDPQPEVANSERIAARDTKPLVATLLPRAAIHQLSVRATGSVVVRGHVALTPEVTGRITWISPALRPGGSFSAGEALLRLATEDFDLAIDQARAEVASARAGALLVEAQSEAARTNYALIHPEQPVPSLVAKLPQIEQARAQLDASQARLDIALLERDRTTFSLPFDGRVTETSAQTGQMLSRGQTFGQAFALDAVEAIVPLAAGDLIALEPIVGRRAILTTRDGTVTATVERMSAALNDRTRFARAYLVFQPHGRFIPGTFIEAAFEGPALANTFTLPEAAAQDLGTVWVVRNGLLQRQVLEVRGRNSRGLIVTAFDSGEGIVLGPVPGAAAGQAVALASNRPALLAGKILKVMTPGAEM